MFEIYLAYPAKMYRHKCEGAFIGSADWRHSMNK